MSKKIGGKNSPFAQSANRNKYRQPLVQQGTAHKASKAIARKEKMQNAPRPTPTVTFFHFLHGDCDEISLPYRYH